MDDLHSWDRWNTTPVTRNRLFQNLPGSDLPKRMGRWLNQCRLSSLITHPMARSLCSTGWEGRYQLGWLFFPRNRNLSRKRDWLILLYSRRYKKKKNGWRFLYCIDALSHYSPHKMCDKHVIRLKYPQIWFIRLWSMKWIEFPINNK